MIIGEGTVASPSDTSPKVSQRGFTIIVAATKQEEGLSSVSTK